MADVAVPTFESWFLATLPSAKRLARRFDGSGIDTEDAIAEAFARAYVRWQQVCLLPYAEAWLLRVLLNLLLDRSRRKSPGPVTDLAPDATDAVVARLAVTSALGQLSRRQRQAVSLRYLADLSEADVSHALGVSRNTVKRHVSRGVEALRQTIGANWEAALED